MKQSIYKSLFFIALLFGALTSCYNPLSEDVSISSVRRGREFTVVPSMIPMVDALATKSQYTGNDDQVYDWNLFIFEGTSDAAVLCGKYYNSGSSSDMSISFTVKLDAEYTYFAIANVGKQIDNLAGYTTLGALRSARIAISGPRQGLPAATSFTHKFTRSDYETAQAAHANLTFPSSINKLTRLVGRYDIVVQKNDLQIWDLDITSLRLYGAGSVTPWVTGSYTTQDVVLNDADNGGATNQDLYKLNRGEKVSFYPVENMISTPSALSGNTDMWAKVPGNVGNAHPSYIEMTGTATVNDGSGLSKPVTYRFYLGTDNVKNFEVQRNVTHTLTFVPNDETITNGHNGNWKITPGSFTDTRSLMFASNGTAPTSSTNPIRVRAGESLDEAIIRTVGGSPSNFKYNVSFGGQLASDGNMLVRSETSGDVAQLNGTTLSSLHLTAKANIDAEGFVKINTIDQPNESPKQDKLYVQIYNAWLEITNDPLVLTYEWNARQSGSGQNAGFRSSVNWTASPSSGWSVSPTSGSASLTGTSVSIYPDDVNSSTTANKTGQVTLTPDGGVAKTVTMIQKFKPVVTTQPAELTWTAAQGSSDYQELVITSNETWTLTVFPGWTVKDTNGNPITGGGSSNNGASTSVTVRVYPDGPNASIPPTDRTGSIVITPNRGTDDEKATVTLTHQKAAVSLSLTESGHDWTWKQKDVDADNFTFHVTGNLNWSASVSDPDNWRIVSGASGSGNGNVVVRPKAVNSSTSDIKGATLTIQCTDSGVTVDSPTATLRQLVHPNIGLASSGNLQWAWDNTTVQTITLTLSPADYGWQAALVNGDASHWVMTEDHTNNTISIRPATVNDDVNNAPSIQVRITATDPDDTQSSAVVTCTHNARAAYFNFVDPSQQTLSWRWYEGASNTITVEFSTSEEWTPSVSVGGSYFTATKNGNSVVIAPTNANDGAVREGTVSLVVDGHPELNKTISLTQEAKPSLSVVPDNKEWAWDNTNSQNFTVTCSSGYTWSAAKTTDPGNKFTLTNTTGASNAAFTVTPAGINENTDQGNAATITVSLVNANDPHAGEVTATVNVTQTKKVQFYITPTSNEWGWQGGTFQFTVVDNQGLSWTPEVFGTNASAFTATRSGNTVNVTVNQNNDFDVKSATLRIKVGGEVKASASLSQEAHPWLELTALDGTSWAYNETDGKQFEVSSSGISSWTPTIDNTSEFTVSTNGSIVTVTPKSANTGTSPRSVRVTVTSNNYSVDGQSDYHDLSQGVNGGMVTGATLQVYNGSSWVTNATFTVGAQQSYRVKVDYLSGSSEYVTSGFELTSGSSGIVSVNSNKISTTAAGEGSTSVSTTYSGINTSVSITVQPAGPTYTYELYIDASATSIKWDGYASFTAYIRRYADGNLDTSFSPVDVSSSCDWDMSSVLKAVSTYGGHYYVSANNTTNSYVEGSVSATYNDSIYDVTDATAYIGFGIGTGHKVEDRLVIDDDELDWNGTTTAQYQYRECLWDGSSWSWSDWNDASAKNWSINNSYPVDPRPYVSVDSNGIITANNTTGKDLSGVRVSCVNTDYSWNYVSCNFTVKAKPVAIDHYEYKDLAVSISADPMSISAAGGSSTLSYSASWQKRAVYTDNSRGDWEDESDTPTVTGEATGFSRNGTSVTISGNTGTDSRSVTYTASYSLPDGSVIVSGDISDEASVTITQAGNKPVFMRYEYKDLAVSISADPTSIPAAGGSSTLSYSATWKVREVWSDGAKAWTEDSGTSSISGETSWAVLQSDNKTVVISETGIPMARSATFTASYTLDTDETHVVVSGSGSASASVIIEQDRTPYLESLEFRINSSNENAELNAGNGYSLSYSLKGIYSDGSEVDYAPSMYTVTYNTSARGLLFSQGTVRLNGNAYFELDEGSYSNIDEYASVTYNGLTSNNVHLTSNITWEFLGIGYHAEASNGGEVTFHKFYHSTLSTNTIRDAGALTDFTYNGSITSVTGVPNISDVNLSLSTRTGGILTITAFSTYSYYEYTAVINVNSSLGHYTLTVYGGSDNGWPFFSFDGITYQANAH